MLSSTEQGGVAEILALKSSKNADILNAISVHLLDLTTRRKENQEALFPAQKWV